MQNVAKNKKSEHPRRSVKNIPIGIFLKCCYFYPMNKAERTRQHILEKTAPLFNARGFEGTSMADLTQATGLTKGALYGHFNDKEDMAIAAFAYAMERIKAAAKARIDAYPTYKEQLKALLYFFSEYVFDPPVPGGCPLLNTAVEADDYFLAARPVVVEKLVNTVNFIVSLLEKGIEAGEFLEDTDTRKIAYAFFCAVEGAIMFSRVERSREPMDLVVAHCLNVLDELSK